VSATYAVMTEADLPAVTALEQRIHAFPWTVGNFRDSLQAGHAAWVHYQDDGQLAAYAVTMPVVDEEHLLTIGVAPERQRHGLGAALLEFLCQRAQQAGMRCMLLEVRASNQVAMAFYEHFAFAEIGRRRNYYPASSGREDAIVMAKGL
jgi:ribosomal-protein-alanine N-acetyltransferase